MANVSNTIALAVASIFLAAIVGYVIWRGLAAVRRVGTFFLLFTVGMAFYGGSKGFWRSVNFPRTDLDVAYLTDNDSRVWSTNFVHLAFTPASMVPQDAQIYLDYRAAASTNDEDWVTYTNATLAAFPNPLDFEFENATNYSWMCYTTWTPGAAEVTNGVVRIGWLLPMDGATNTIVMHRTGVRYKSHVPYDAEVEYIRSTGTQWIDTGVVPDATTSAKTRVYVYGTTGNVVLGFFGNDDKKDWRLFNPGGTLYWDIGNSRLSKSGAFPGLTWKELEVGNNYAKDLGSGEMIVTGNTVETYQATGTILLCAKEGGVYCSQCWFSYVQILKSGKIIRDLIAVRFTNEQGVSEGAMYDRANPTVGMNPDGSPRTDGLYRNRGTGAFLYGADKTN